MNNLMYTLIIGTGAARLQSLITHAVFGLGLYLSGWANHFIFMA